MAKTNLCMLKIPFNIPFVSGNEITYINKVISSNTFSSPGIFTKKCEEKLSKITGCKNIKLTTSCTSALELAALALDIKAGDEVIVPSFTFVSSANAFALSSAKLIFLDINPQTMCLDYSLLKNSISKKTKAVVLVHYAGLTEEVDKIAELCKQKGIFLVEDAAQSINSYYNNKHLGTFGDIGCISFHDTKNIHCGEGGAILINNKSLIHKIEVCFEKGTNRADFLAGKIANYSWQSLGSSYGLSEINAAFLYAQLLSIKKVTTERQKIYSLYQKNLNQLRKKGIIDFPETKNKHNAHIFFIKCNSESVRNNLLTYLKKNGISAHVHYSPLHKSNMGKQFKFIKSKKDFSLSESKRMLRLPLYYNMSKANEITKLILNFYNQ